MSTPTATSFTPGRSDDVIISGGWTMSALEIEQALLAHPDVREAAVIGVPDELRGQIPKGVHRGAGQGPRLRARAAGVREGPAEPPRVPARHRDRGRSCPRPRPARSTGRPSATGSDSACPSSTPTLASSSTGRAPAACPSREVAPEVSAEDAHPALGRVYRLRDGAAASGQLLFRPGDNSWAGLRDDIGVQAGALRPARVPDRRRGLCGPVHAGGHGGAGVPAGLLRRRR